MDFRSPRSSHVFSLLYQNASKHQENYGNILGNIIFVNTRIIFRTFFLKHVKALRTFVFFVFLVFISTIRIAFYIIFCEDEDRTLRTFPLIKSRKAWMRTSYLSKTWNRNLVNPESFSIFNQGNHLTLISRKYLQSRESSNIN